MSFVFGTNKRNDQILRVIKSLEAVRKCPECGSHDVYHSHHNADFYAPECTYLSCGDCYHQWGHE